MRSWLVTSGPSVGSSSGCRRRSAGTGRRPGRPWHPSRRSQSARIAARPSQSVDPSLVGLTFTRGKSGHGAQREGGVHVAHVDHADQAHVDLVAQHARRLVGKQAAPRPAQEGAGPSAARPPDLLGIAGGDRLDRPAEPPAIGQRVADEPGRRLLRAEMLDQLEIFARAHQQAGEAVEHRPAALAPQPHGLAADVTPCPDRSAARADGWSGG